MRRALAVWIILLTPILAFAQEAPPLDDDTVIRKGGEDEDLLGGALGRTRRSIKRSVEGEQARREIEDLELIQPRPLHPGDRLTLRSLRYWIQQRDALRERVGENPTAEEKEALEAIEEKIEERTEDLGLDPYARFLGRGTLSFARIDYRRNRDFNQKIYDNDTFIPQRLDFGVEVGLLEAGRVVGVGTLSNTASADLPRDDFEDKLDLFELYYEPHFFRAEAIELTPKLGRQVLRYGNQRILGDDAFSVFHRSFDAARIDLDLKRFELSAFIGRVIRRRDFQDDDFNKADENESLVGTYNAVTLNAGLRLELYGLRKQTTRRFLGERRFGSSTVVTAGARLLINQREGLGAELEGILQTGRVNGDHHRALAGAAALTYIGLYAPIVQDEDAPSLDPRIVARANALARYRFRFGLEWASGDNDPFDGKSRTFQPVYPSQHDFQGDADVLGFQNVYDLYAEARYQWRGEVDDSGFSTIELRAAYHTFRLDSNRDAAYDFNGFRIVQGNGRNGRELGQEIDVSVTFWDLIAVGWARFFPGRFLRGSGRTDPVDYFYIAIR